MGEWIILSIYIILRVLFIFLNLVSLNFGRMALDWAKHFGQTEIVDLLESYR